MLILLLLEAGGAVSNTQVALCWYIRLNSIKYLTARLGHKMRKPVTVYSVGVRMQQYADYRFEASPELYELTWISCNGEYVHGMATDRLLMRPLSALVLSSPPGAPVDALHLISIEFHSTGLVYSKYICFN